MKRRIFIIVLSLVVCLCLPMGMEAKSKGLSKKDTKRWNSVVTHLENNETSSAIDECYDIIAHSEQFDSVAVLARSVLAAHYLSNPSMGDIYDGYVFFREYLKKNPGNAQASRLATELHDFYWKLVNDEMARSDSVTDGIYISDRANKKGMPYMALSIKDNGMSVELDPRCELYAQMAKYDTKDDVNPNNIHEPATIKVNRDSMALSHPFMAEWGTLKVDDPNASLAENLAEGGAKIQSDLLGVAKRAPSSGDWAVDMGVQAGMTLFAGLINLGLNKAAEEAARGTVTASGLVVNMGYFENGKMDVVAKTVLHREFNDNKPDVDEMDSTAITLYKLYPHDEVCFDNGLTYDSRGLEHYSKPKDNKIKNNKKAFWASMPLLYFTAGPFGLAAAVAMYKSKAKPKGWMGRFPAIMYPDGNLQGLSYKTKNLNWHQYAVFIINRLYAPLLTEEVQAIVNAEKVDKIEYDWADGSMTVKSKHAPKDKRNFNFSRNMKNGELEFRHQIDKKSLLFIHYNPDDNIVEREVLDVVKK